MLPGDIVTWLLDARLPHIGIVAPANSTGTTVVNNIGGVEETPLGEFRPDRAIAHYRWPVNRASSS